ncbi:MAG: tripartite tricarboxylate transporter substrate binding protein [Spirochaetales bacterium]|nr:tripartite tricarboxylate transporter substrate binding protein [Spirochaetales bacterium]
MKKLVVILAAMLMLTGMVFASGQADSAGMGSYPERDITTAVVWGAGGGTDVCNRVVMAEMSKALGVNVNVINKTGGAAGSVGMTYGYSAAHDGYTITGLSESNVTAGVKGAWSNRFNVWDTFIIGGSPDVVSVTPDAPYNTIEELVEAAKAAPDSILAGASGSGSIHHLNLLALENGSGADFQFIPYDGSAPAQNAAMTGEITVIVTSVAEQAELIRGGKLKPLGMLIPESFDLNGTVIPSAFDAYADLSKYLPLPQSIGFAVPADVPQEVKDVLYEAFDKSMASDAVKAFGEEKYYVLSGKRGPEANEVFAALESNFAWTLWDLGAADVNPADLNIPKP